MKFLAPAAALFGLIAIGCTGGATEDANNAPPATNETPANNAMGTNDANNAAPTNNAATATTASYAQVQEIFNKSCIGCHGANNPKEGINLTSYETVMKGGKEGPIVVAGNPDDSELVDVLHGRDDHPRMPMKADPLAADQIAIIENWVKAGATNT